MYCFAEIDKEKPNIQPKLHEESQWRLVSLPTTDWAIFFFDLPDPPDGAHQLPEKLSSLIESAEESFPLALNLACNLGSDQFQSLATPEDQRVFCEQLCKELHYRLSFQPNTAIVLAEALTDSDTPFVERKKGKFYWVSDFDPVNQTIRYYPSRALGWNETKADDFSLDGDRLRLLQLQGQLRKPQLLL